MRKTKYGFVEGKKGFNCVSCGTRLGGRAGACHSPKREPRPIPKGGVSGTLMHGVWGDCWRAPLVKHKGAPEVPRGSEPYPDICSRSRTSLAIRGLFKLAKKELNFKNLNL
jgi:hypothetical protein